MVPSWQGRLPELLPQRQRRPHVLAGRDERRAGGALAVVMGRQPLPGRRYPSGRRDVLPQARRATEAASFAGRALSSRWLLAKPGDEGSCLCQGRRLYAGTSAHFMGNGHLAILRSAAGQLKCAIADVRSSNVRSGERSPPPRWARLRPGRPAVTTLHYKQERLTHSFLAHGLQGAAAYERFLFDYIDTKISVDNLACDPSKFPASKPVADIVAAIQPKKSSIKTNYGEG